MAPTPRAETPEVAADEFVEWFNLLPLDTDPPTPFIAPRPTGWSKVVDVEGRVAFGWNPVGLSVRVGFYTQLLILDSDGSEWWVDQFETGSC